MEPDLGDQRSNQADADPVHTNRQGKSIEFQSMLDAAKYSRVELLRNGRRAEIRALRPEDRAELLAAVSRASAQSLFRRFFAAKSSFTEQEIAFYLNVDFISHVALVAVLQEDSESAIAGGGRYIMVQPGTAEVAFAVVDQYQGQGIGGALMRHLVAIARDSGLKELIAEVLQDNTPMLRVFETCGQRIDTTRERGVVHVLLHLSWP
jgi:RimJ/RimL family protein N-acetyltransferase